MRAYDTSQSAGVTRGSQHSHLRLAVRMIGRLVSIAIAFRARKKPPSPANLRSTSSNTIAETYTQQGFTRGSTARIHFKEDFTAGILSYLAVHALLLFLGRFLGVFLGLRSLLLALALLSRGRRVGLELILALLLRGEKGRSVSLRSAVGVTRGNGQLYMRSRDTWQ